MYSFPFIDAFDSSVVYVAWLTLSNNGTNDLHLIKSTDGGNHFAGIASAIPSGFVGDRISQQLVITKSEQLYFLWPPNGEDRTVLFQSVKENETASATTNPVKIYSSSNQTNSVSAAPLAANDLGSVYVVFVNSTLHQSSSSLSSGQILIRTSTDGGLTFGDIMKVQDILAVPEFDPAFASLVMAVAIVGVLVVSVGWKRRGTFIE